MVHPPAEALPVHPRRASLTSGLQIGAHVLEILSLALWLGGFITAGAVVAPLAFKLLARPEAGRLMGAIFERLNGIGIACGVVLLLALAIEGSSRATSRSALLTRAALVGGALALALYLGAILFPEMKELRGASTNVATPAFDRMHALSRQLLSLQMLLLLGALVGSASSARKRALE